MSIDNKNLNISDTSFLAVSTTIQNTNMVWANGNTTLGANWGAAPTAMDGLTATLRLQINSAQIRLHKLSPIGAVVSSTIINPTVPNSNVFEITINQGADQTMWYAIERFGNVALPIYNVTLQANRTNNATALDWNTNIADGFKTYIVQRSVDGIQFENLTTLNSTGITKYTYTDYAMLTGKLYYRIEAITERGTKAYSNIIVVDRNNSKTMVYPNPANDIINVITTSNETGSFRLFDEKDSLVKKQTIQNTNNAINITNLANGNYFYEIQTNTGVKKGTVVISINIYIQL
jgi:hypothetical protein